VLCASAVWHVDALGRFTPRARVAVAAGGVTGTAPADVDAPAPMLAPRLESSCHVAMCVAVASMLVLLR
jgi:hypothetical protein